MRKVAGLLLAVLAALLSVVTPASGHESSRRGLPLEIDLPSGFFPEGIASGRGSTFYVGSLADGSIYRGDYRTGSGEVLTEPFGQFSTVGLSVDRHNRVWVAGGVSGTGRVYDGRSGELLATYQLTEPGQSFINDVIVTKRAAWFTDSGTQVDPDPSEFRLPGSPRLFEVPLGRRGKLAPQSEVTELPLDVPDIGFPNLNGIETTPNRRGLIVAHVLLGQLFTVDPATGSARPIDLGAPLQGPDGLVRRGRTLHVVENAAAQIASVRLNRRGTRGEIVRVRPVEGAETPTTAAIFRGGIYVPDARFNSMSDPYKVFRVPLHRHHHHR